MDACGSALASGLSFLLLFYLFSFLSFWLYLFWVKCLLMKIHKRMGIQRSWICVGYFMMAESILCCIMLLCLYVVCREMLCCYCFLCMSWWNSRGGIKGLLMKTCASIVFTLAFIKSTNKGNLDMLCYSFVFIHEFCLSAAPATNTCCF